MVLLATDWLCFLFRGIRFTLINLSGILSVPQSDWFSHLWKCCDSFLTLNSGKSISLSTVIAVLPVCSDTAVTAQYAFVCYHYQERMLLKRLTLNIRNRITLLFSEVPCNTGRLVWKKNCFSAWASTLNMGLINKG